MKRSLKKIAGFFGGGIVASVQRMKSSSLLDQGYGISWGDVTVVL